MVDSTRLDRFVEKIAFHPGGCWEWTAAKDWTGYGRFADRGGRTIAAHRFGYRESVGPIPAVLDLDHLCRNRACVNPDHLEPVSRAENLRRRPLARIPGAPYRDRRPKRPSPRKTEAERFWEKVEMTPCGGCWNWTAAKVTGYGSFGLTGGRKTVLAHRWAYESEVGPIPDGMFIDHLCRNRGCVNPSHLEPVTPAENTRRGPGSIPECKRGHPLPERTGPGRRRCKECAALVWKEWASQPENAERLKERDRKRAVIRSGGRKRGDYQRAKTHCPQGHPYNEENTHIRADGRRSCRQCNRDYMARRRAERKAQA